MPIPPARLLRELRTAFQFTQATMSELHGAVQIRPSNAEEVIQSTGNTATEAHFECRPVVCLLPERASSPTANVYVVYRGLLSLETDPTHGVATTASYSTDFAYFQTSDEGVTHALGGHYDFGDGDIAHPRAHLQLKSQADMWTDAGHRFPSVEGLQIGTDPMLQILNRVRAPSAQMDFLSFMIQLAADHLVDGKSLHATRTRFRTLTSSCKPFAGYNVHPAHDSGDCHRGCHWYRQSPSRTATARDADL